MSVETIEAPAAEKKTRIKRSPAELKAARVAKAQKALDRVKDSGDKVVKRAADLAEKARKAQAKADEHAEALLLAERNLAWEQARPVRGEVLSADGDFEVDEDEDTEDADLDFEDEDDEDGDENTDGL